VISWFVVCRHYPHLWRKLCGKATYGVWIDYFNEAIYFFKEFKFFYDEMFCLDRKIKNHLKYKHFVLNISIS